MKNRTQITLKSQEKGLIQFSLERKVAIVPKPEIGTWTTPRISTERTPR